MNDKKYKVSGMRENKTNWEYIGKRTIKQVEECKVNLVYIKYRLTDTETGEQTIIKDFK